MAINDRILLDLLNDVYDSDIDTLIEDDELHMPLVNFENDIGHVNIADTMTKNRFFL